MFNLDEELILIIIIFSLTIFILSQLVLLL